jgi:hypothetical protein
MDFEDSPEDAAFRAEARSCSSPRRFSGTLCGVKPWNEEGAPTDAFDPVTRSAAPLPC